MPWLVSGVEADVENILVFFLEADVGITESLEFFPEAMLVGCRVREFCCRVVDASVKGVLPRQVAQAAIAPMTLISRSSVEGCE